MVFTRASAYIAFPIIIALYLGKYLDNRWSTSPYLVLASLVLAFTTSVTLIWRSLKTYMKDLKEFTIDTSKDKK